MILSRYGPFSTGTPGRYREMYMPLSLGGLLVTLPGFLPPVLLGRSFVSMTTGRSLLSDPCQSVLNRNRLSLGLCCSVSIGSCRTGLACSGTRGRRVRAGAGAGLSSMSNIFGYCWLATLGFLGSLLAEGREQNTSLAKSPMVVRNASEPALEGFIQVI